MELPSDIYIQRLVRTLTELDPDRPVMCHHDRNIPAAKFLNSIYRYTRALADLGIDRDGVVALLAPNSPDAIAIRYAAHLLGAAATYLSAPPLVDARRKLVEDIDPTIIVIFPSTAHLLPAGLDLKVVSVGNCGSAYPRLDRRASRQSDDIVSCQARPGDLAVVISSGGSTGVPKGSCRNFDAYTRVVGAPSGPDRRQLVNGRLPYLSQILVDVTLLNGGLVVLRDGFDAADTLAQIETQRITDLFLVEPQLFELMDHPDVPETDLSTLRSLVHIGASAPEVLRTRAIDRLGRVIVHTYGASEEGIVSILPSVDYTRKRMNCAGKILPEVEVRFRRPDGSLADPGEPGTIELKSPNMAHGYRNRPELTSAAFRDGWYRSGDLGFVDDDQYLHILGRADDIQRIGDTLVTPTSIENTLCNLACVRYAAVLFDRDRGLRIAAVEPWPGSAVAEADCREAVAVNHGQDVAQTLVIVNVSRVPLTEQGKPDRNAIRQLVP